MKWIAHRGIHDKKHLVENSEQSIVKAMESNVSGIEVDLRMLGSGDIVLHHDRCVGEELNSKFTLLSNLTLDKFRNIVQHDTLTLQELLELNNGRKTLFLEMKSHKNNQAFGRRLIKILTDVSSKNSLILSSQIWQLLNLIKTRTKFKTAPILRNLNPLDRKNLRQKDFFQIHLEKSAWKGNVLDFLLRLGYHHLIAWTIHSKDEIPKIDSNNIEGIMTDNSNFFTIN